MFLFSMISCKKQKLNASASPAASLANAYAKSQENKKAQLEQAAKERKKLISYNKKMLSLIKVKKILTMFLHLHLCAI